MLGCLKCEQIKYAQPDVSTNFQLQLHTEIGKDWAGSSFGSSANLPFLDQNLFYVGATRNHCGNSGCGYARAVNHVARFKHLAISNQMGKTDVCYLAAMWEHYILE